MTNDRTIPAAVAPGLGPVAAVADGPGGIPPGGPETADTGRYGPATGNERNPAAAEPGPARIWECSDSNHSERVAAVSPAAAFVASWGREPAAVRCATDLRYLLPAPVANLDVDEFGLTMTFRPADGAVESLVLEVRPADIPEPDSGQSARFETDNLFGGGQSAQPAIAGERAADTDGELSARFETGAERRGYLDGFLGRPVKSPYRIARFVAAYHRGHQAGHSARVEIVRGFARLTDDVVVAVEEAAARLRHPAARPRPALVCGGIL